MSRCSQCESMLRDLPEAGVLYLAPQLSYTRGKLRRILWESGLPFGAPSEGVLAVEIAPEGLKCLSRLMIEGLEPAELKDCSAVLVEKGSAFGLGALPRMQDLATLTAVVRSEWLVEMMQEDRLTVHFQPIVSAVSPEKVFAYECLLRGLDEEDGLVSPGAMLGAAREAELLFSLDRAARIKAIGEANGFALEQNIFINFNPTSIHEPGFCLRSTLGAIERSNLCPERIVFEVTESEEIKDQKRLKRILDFCRERGFKVALADLGAGYSSLNLLSSLRPDFVKLDASLIRDVDCDPYRAIIASRLLKLAKVLGVTVVAEGLETEEQWLWLVAHGVDFVQGFFFDRPASPPPAPTPLYA